jgi:hypothetical protein
MNQTIASTNPAAMVLMVSNASTDGPGSPPRASCAVSTMRLCALVAAIFVLGLGAAGFVPNALVVAITPSFHRMHEIRACLGNERGVVTEVPSAGIAGAAVDCAAARGDLFKHSSGACVKPGAAAASRCQGLFSYIYSPKKFSGLLADAAVLEAADHRRPHFRHSIPSPSPFRHSAFSARLRA